MEEKIFVTRSSMPPYEEYIEAIKPLWETHWLTNMGKYHVKLEQRLKEYYEVFPSQGSFAINYCFATEGQFAGVVSLTKDAFPEFAGLFIANEAGLNATNIKGEKDISPNDRVFVCGDEEDYDKLIQIVKEELNLEGK